MCAPSFECARKPRVINKHTRSRMNRRRWRKQKCVELNVPVVTFKTQNPRARTAKGKSRAHDVDSPSRSKQLVVVARILGWGGETGGGWGDVGRLELQN